MSEHHGSHASDTSSVEHWEDRYSGEQVWSGNPNSALVAEAATLAPGSALDVGCGEGADAVWLARQGWQVTALDISAKAVARTLGAAETAGVRLTGVASPFLDATLIGPFDLVSCMYPVMERSADHLSEQRLASLVAPGGTLLFVHHEMDEEHIARAREHGFDPERYLAPGDIARWFGELDGWEVATDERRDRHVDSGAGAGHVADLVVRVTRALG